MQSYKGQTIHFYQANIFQNIFTHYLTANLHFRSDVIIKKYLYKYIFNTFKESNRIIYSLNTIVKHNPNNRCIHGTRVSNDNHLINYYYK